MKQIDSKQSKLIYLHPIELKAQYNPLRFKYWKSLHKGPENEVLNMFYSPHYRFLKNYKEQTIEKTSYYKLQKLYGRNHKWIKNKIDQFITLFEDIKNNGYDPDKALIVLTHPIVQNPYNYSYEIFEGHHRVACCLFLDIENILIELKIG